MATLTVFPDANPETTSVDGVASRLVAGEAFTTIRNGAGTTFTDSVSNDTSPLLRATTTSNTYDYLRRSIFVFDTSALTSSASISGATVSVYISGKANPLGSPDIHIAGATTSSNTTLSNSDYENVGRTSFASIAYASISASGYNNWSLNSSGISNINTTGVSKFSCQLDWDINNSTTGLTWVSSATSGQGTRLVSEFAEDSGTSFDPKLVVTYTTTSSVTASVSDSPTITESTVASIANNIGTSPPFGIKASIKIKDF